ncbi:MAG: DUF47 family protein [Monoglobales bacterium]
MAKKKFDYFNYFKEVSDLICEAADHLHLALHNHDTSTLQEKIDVMHEIEHKADCAKHEMTKYLAHEFITPIEREDIISLAQALDTVVDNMEDVLLRIYMFNVESIKTEVLEYSDVIIKCAKELNGVLVEFKNFKNSEIIKSRIVAVNNFESDGDKLLVDGVRNLSINPGSDKDLFIWTDIFEHLELCLDACEDVTDIIEEVIMKNT